MTKVDKNYKTKEIFHYFNIQTNIDSVFGNWAVSSKGDVVNILYPCVIFSFHLNDCNWIETIKKKVWFEQESEDSLHDALIRADMIVCAQKVNHI